jgi:hypothetical protein
MKAFSMWKVLSNTKKRNPGVLYQYSLGECVWHLTYERQRGDAYHGVRRLECGT